jgi:hypothetical protein
MSLGSIALTLLLAGTPAEVTVVNFPAKGTVSLGLMPSGKLDIERMGTISQIRIDVDKMQPPQKLDALMNAYVVWAVSPEGGFENVGELAVSDGKAHLETVTKLDQFGILITAEPHYLVDKPNIMIVSRNGTPKADSIRRNPITVEVGSYDYTKLQPAAAMGPSIVLQARAALQLATAGQAERFAESEFRLARIALGTAEEMLGRSSSMEIIFPAANESIRRSQRALIMARENMAASTLESAKNDATALRRDSQQFQDRIVQLMKEQTTEQDEVRRLNADLATAIRDRQQLTRDRDAAVNRSQSAEKDLAAAQSGTGLKLPAEYFDLSKEALTPAGFEALTDIAKTFKLWINPLLIYVPENALQIAKKFLSDSGVPESRVVIVPER